MTFEQLTHYVATRTRITQRQARSALYHAMAMIGCVVHEGEEVRLPQFGTFCLGETKPRRIRDLATGEMRTLPQSLRLKFRAAKAQRRAK
jgi:DNA-binding protein HU-beta